jgi:hypothetical protein
MIQAQAASESFLRQATGLMQDQFVNFARIEVHNKNSPLSHPRIVTQRFGHKSQVAAHLSADLLAAFARDAKHGTLPNRAGTDNQIGPADDREGFHFGQ